MRNKTLINTRNDITHSDGSSVVLSPWKGRGKKEKRKYRYYNTQYSYLVTHPSTYAAEQDSNLLNRRNMLLSLWYSDSTLNAFFLSVKD